LAGSPCQHCNSVAFSDLDDPVPVRIRAAHNNSACLSSYASGVKQLVQLVMELFNVVHACPAVTRQRRVRSYARAPSCADQLGGFLLLDQPRRPTREESGRAAISRSESAIST
jgi:hypothetical protein